MALPWTRRRTAERELVAMRAAYDDALVAGGLVIVRQVHVGADAHHVSASVAEVLGWDPSSFLQPGRLRGLVHVEDLPTFRTVGMATHAEAPIVRLGHAQGGWRSFRFDVIDPGLDQPLHLTLVDVTKDQPAFRKRRRAEELLEVSTDAVLVLALLDPGDPESLLVIDRNAAAAELLGIAEQATGAPLSSRFSDATSQLVRSAAFDTAHTGERLTFERLRFDEAPGKRMELTLDRMRDGTIALRFRDITRQADLEDHLRQRAHHDQRSGLASVAGLEERLAEASQLGRLPVGLVVVDLLDDDLGDALVTAVGQRMANVVGRSPLVARVAERRVAVLLEPDVEVDYDRRRRLHLEADAGPMPVAISTLNESELATIARTVAAALEVPVDVDGHAVDVRAAIGAAMTDRPGTGLRLLRAAESAAASAAANAVAWALEQRPEDEARGGVLDTVRTGLVDGDIELRFQPVIDLRTGRVVKVEALLRWRNPDADRSPGMLDLVERSGLVAPLGRWILGEAAMAAADLQAVQPGLKVAVNLSSFGSTEDLHSFLALLAADGIDARGRLEIEITESLLSDDPLRTADFVARMNELGLTVAVDDFGAGFTSLGAVSGLAVSGLKIDRSFIATMAAIPQDAAVVASTIEFCHQLGIEVTAVGVADEPTLANLRAMRCDLAQGFLLSEPVTLERLLARIRELEAAYT
jgi:EAL domain-containing protein (putative c-di-GMP-specific phosphodiesterase class I)/GGDEF domain-containing protein